MLWVGINQLKMLFSQSVQSGKKVFSPLFKMFYSSAEELECGRVLPVQLVLPVCRIPLDYQQSRSLFLSPFLVGRWWWEMVVSYVFYQPTALLETNEESTHEAVRTYKFCSVALCIIRRVKF